MNFCLLQWTSLRARASRWQVGRVARERRRHASGPSRNTGFTLIELMVVLVLIGILSAMILPEMKGTYADTLLRSSARELVNVFKLAYSQAVSRNELHVVRFEASTGHFALERRLPGPETRSRFAPLKDISGSSGDIDHRITVEIHKSTDASDENSGSNPENSGSNAELASSQQPEHPPDNTLTFYPDGTADAAEVLLRDQAGFGLRLRIDPMTARVEIFELSRK